MARKPSLADIAHQASVGTATVERVLNARGNVRAETAERVIIAARKLGYDRALPELHNGIIRIEVIMVQPDSAFFKRMNKAFTRIAATLSRSIHVQRTFVCEADLNVFSRHILKPEARRSGLIVVAPDDPRTRESLMCVRASGVPVVTIVSRIDECSDAFVGIDNLAAGRAAAHFLTNFNRHRRGSILALSHSAAYEAHRQRISGFCSFMERCGVPDHDFLPVVFGRDDPRATEVALREAFASTKNVIGLYNAGGANRAVADILRPLSAQGNSVIWIGHELTENSRNWLKSGLMHLVLDQAPEIQARRALDTVLSLLGMMEVAVDARPVPFITYTSENC